MTVEGLSPCHEYQFRVFAENLYGRSEPSDPTSIVKSVTEREGRMKKGMLGDCDSMTLSINTASLIPSVFYNQHNHCYHFHLQKV